MRCLLLLLCLGCSGLAAAQPSGGAFDRLEVSLTPTFNLNRNFLHEFWDVAPGAELHVGTPFYRGYLESGVRWERFSPWYGGLPGFDAVLLYGGWGLRSSADTRIQLSAGARVGSLRMAFNKAEQAGVRNESELTLGVTVRSDLRLSNRLSLFASGAYHKTFTFIRLNLYHLSAGLTLRVTTPAWMRRLLD